MYSNGNGGRRSLPPYVLYGAIAVALLVALYLVINLATAGLRMHFALVAGVLLLLINGRELIGTMANRDMRMPLANTLIGAALICVWLTAMASLFWLPALALAAAAVPLALNRMSATAYIGAARTAATRVQRSISKVRLN